MTESPQKQTSKRPSSKTAPAVPSVPIDTVWKALTIASVCWILVQSRSVIQFQQEARKHNFPVNDLSDLWIMLVSLAVIFVFRKWLTGLVSDRVRTRQLLVDRNASEVKIDKSIRALVSVTWYTFSLVALPAYLDLWILCPCWPRLPSENVRRRL